MSFVASDASKTADVICAFGKMCIVQYCFHKYGILTVASNLYKLFPHYTGLELLRLPELLWYAINVCCSRSKAEAIHIRNSIKYEFMFGEHYARYMMIFSMTIMFR